MSEVPTKIVGRKRILAALRRMCRAKIPLLMTKLEEHSLAVKGRMSALEVQLENEQDDKSKVSSLFIHEVSERGLNFLKGITHVHVEFRMTAMKLMFDSPVISCSRRSIFLGVPDFMTSLDKRKNVRVPTRESMQAYVESSLILTDKFGIFGPFFSHYSRISKRISVDNISLGGLSLSTRFPFLLQGIEVGSFDPSALLYLPLLSSPHPIPISIKVKWMRQQKSPIENKKGVHFVTEYKLGIEFQNLDEASRMIVNTYIQRLNEDHAI
ncbi:MAG: hypothetical protein KA436_05590 [Oligoflexales bacterium]|nr:hypothetical protein [Oligoflexales bacterium]